jgi:CDP-paratose 2-epimerase
MSVALVTGSAGLIGSETCKKFHASGFDVAGVDNNMRAQFFGAEASTLNTRKDLQNSLPRYRHHDLDIRDTAAIHALFAGLGKAVQVVVHTAAQPSHAFARLGRTRSTD